MLRADAALKGARALLVLAPRRGARRGAGASTPAPAAIEGDAFDGRFELPARHGRPRAGRSRRRSAAAGDVERVEVADEAWRRRPETARPRTSAWTCGGSTS